MAIINKLYVGLATPIGIALAASSASGQEVVARGYVDSLTAVGTQLYWKAGCGDDFSPPLSYVRTRPDWLPARFAFGYPDGTPVFQPPACGADRVASSNIAVDDLYVYWITSDRRLVRVPRSGYLAAPVTLNNVDAGTGRYSVAVSGGWIAWTDGHGVFRTRTGRPFSRVETLVEPDATARMTDLRPSGDGYVLRSHGALRRLLPLGPGFAVVPVAAAGAGAAFAVSGDRIYVATPHGSNTYVIRLIRPDGGFSDLYRSGARPGEGVSHIAVAGDTIYWHVENRMRQQGPLVRMTVGGLPFRLTGDVPAAPESPLIVNSGFLFWADNEGLRRMLASTASLGPLG